MATTKANLRRWQGPTRITNARLNEAWDLLAQLADLLGVALPVNGAARRPTIPPGARLGKIVAVGPNAEANFPDERYWVQELAIASAAAWGEPLVGTNIDPLTATDPSTGGAFTLARIVPVTNVPEQLSHSHALSVNQLVLYFSMIDRREPTPNVRYVMAVGGTGGKGQYQHQGNVMVSDNQAGWDAPRAHDTLPNPI
jgi:hypothetical protein